MHRRSSKGSEAWNYQDRNMHAKSPRKGRKRCKAAWVITYCFFSKQLWEHATLCKTNIRTKAITSPVLTKVPRTQGSSARPLPVMPSKQAERSLPTTCTKLHSFSVIVPFPQAALRLSRISSSAWKRTQQKEQICSVHQCVGTRTERTEAETNVSTEFSSRCDADVILGMNTVLS